jgi:hypothetical protein
MRKLKALTVVAAILTLGAIVCPGLSFTKTSRTSEPRAGIQRPDFIPVEGPDLKSRIGSAIERAHAAGRKSPFWTAFSTDVRSGVRVDDSVQDLEVLLDIPSEANIPRLTSATAPSEARDPAFFLLHEPDGDSVTRVEVYDLAGQRDYGGYPVYWLGHVKSGESLEFFQGVIETNRSPRVVERSVMVIALHNDSRVPSILKSYVQVSANKRVRGAALLGLGQVGGEESFLAGLVSDEQQSTELRKQAALSLGICRDKTVLPEIQNIYEAVSQQEVKKHLILAASLNENKDEAASFLAGIARSGADLEIRKQAILWLGLRAGQRGLKALSEIVNSPDADTELQEHAVLALSLSGLKEARPLLTVIATTHPKQVVRQQAVFWLNQTEEGRTRKFR